MVTLGDIDTVLAAEKRMLGQPVWIPDLRRPERSVLSVPLTSATGLAFPALLIGHATLTAPLQRGGLVLLVDGQPVQRMNFAPDNPHANGMRKESPAELRGLRLPAGRSRIYLWEWNRRLPRDAVGEIGKVLDSEPSDFAEALAYFLSCCDIIGSVPAPPYTPRLL